MSNLKDFSCIFKGQKLLVLKKKKKIFTSDFLILSQTEKRRKILYKTLDLTKMATSEQKKKKIYKLSQLSILMCFTEHCFVFAFCAAKIVNVIVFQQN